MKSITLEPPEEYRECCTKIAEVINHYFQNYSRGISDYSQFQDLLQKLPREDAKKAIKIILSLPLSPNLFYVLTLNSLTYHPPKYVMGPVSATYHTFGNRKIYLFGDRHTLGKEEKIPDNLEEIDQFLFRLSQNSPWILDIFLEWSYNHPEKDVDAEKGWIPKINKVFRSCIHLRDKSPDYSKCSPVSRIHVVDFRDPEVFDHLLTLRAFMEALSYLTCDVDSLDKVDPEFWERFVKTIKKEWDKINPECLQVFQTYEGYKNYFFDLIDGKSGRKCVGKFDSKMTKQFESIPLEMKIQIRKFFEIKIDRTIEGAPKITLDELMIQFFASTPEKIESVSLLAQYMMVVFILQSYIQDVYCLARLFRKYRISSLPETKYHPSENLNSIIYVGEEHAKTIREFLDEIGFSTAILPIVGKRIVDLSDHQLFG